MRENASQSYVDRRLAERGFCRFSQVSFRKVHIVDEVLWPLREHGHRLVPGVKKLSIVYAGQMIGLFLTALELNRPPEECYCCRSLRIACHAVATQRPELAITFRFVRLRAHEPAREI